MVDLPAAGRHVGRKMYTVYALRSKIKNWIYVGFTNSLERRVKQHNSGQVRSSKAFKPFDLLFVEKCKTRGEARKLEKYYKHGQGKDKLKSLINMQAGVVELVDTSDSKSDAGYSV